MAENGEEAMRCLEENDIDILFTDIKMPFMDGLELLVLANQKFRSLKIVIFSAFADFNYAKTALENRVLHYFLKPVDPDEFQKVLTEVVESAMEEESKLKRYWEGGGADGINSFHLPGRDRRLKNWSSFFIHGKHAAPSFSICRRKRKRRLPIFLTGWKRVMERRPGA